jgi:hypothetical protein
LPVAGRVFFCVTAERQNCPVSARFSALFMSYFDTCFERGFCHFFSFESGGLRQQNKVSQVDWMAAALSGP